LSARGAPFKNGAKKNQKKDKMLYVKNKMSSRKRYVINGGGPVARPVGKVGGKAHEKVPGSVVIDGAPLI